MKKRRQKQIGRFQVRVLFTDGVPDDQGNVHPFDSEVKFTNRVPVLYNFDERCPIGIAELGRDERGVMADIKVDPARFSEELLGRLYPSVSGYADVSDTDKKVVVACRINAVSLQINPNVDPRIKKLGSQ